MFVRAVVVLSALCALLVPSAAQAAQKYLEPPPDRLYEPARGESAPVAPEVAALARAHGQSVIPTATFTPNDSFSASAPAQSAHIIECWSYAYPLDESPNNYITARGYAQCDGTADVLGDMNCVDIWAVDGYWSQLECGEWRTCGGCTFIRGWSVGRNCTPGRRYRPKSRVSAFHGTASSGTFYGTQHTC